MIESDIDILIVIEIEILFMAHRSKDSRSRGVYSIYSLYLDKTTSLGSLRMDASCAYQVDC